MKQVFFHYRRCLGMGILLLTWAGNPACVHANPTSGSVSQGAATINGMGTSQVTINQTSANALINWQTFNIVPGETTTFNQPSSSSVTWNYIGDPNPNGSSINGTINANGYVILQNPNGISVGGQATITAHGLVLTTASTPALNLSSGGPWSFNAPPPSAQIINSGQINIVGGGSAFLIASDIQNTGTISAPGGKIGFYAGQTVLVSTSPDGRGLSAQVTLPQGSVDNEGNLIADGGSIIAQAQLVNQNGVVQANSAQNVNGTIELVAGDTVNLNANSVVSAEGSSQVYNSAGITVQAGNTVNNNGRVVADASSIRIQAPAVNQNGSLQANSLVNSLGNVPGTIALAASSAINLGASSIISANGDPTATQATPSAGGAVTIQSDNSFSDQTGSSISVSGAVPGGNGGQVTISAPQMTAVNSSINGSASTGTGYTDGSLAIDTANISLNADGNPVAGALSLDVNSWSSGFSQINLQAANKIELSSQWILSNPGTISLLAGNTIAVDAGAKIEADAGKIALRAPTVNQSGTLQADSSGSANGVVEIDAGASLNLGASSVISANGDPTATTTASPGGFVVLNAGNNSFNDLTGSAISVSGTAGGQNGVIEILGNGVTAGTIQSTIMGNYLAYLINPGDIYLSSTPVSSTITGTTPNTQPAGTDPNTQNPQPWANFILSDLSAYSQIDLQALDNIELDSAWTLGGQTVPATPAAFSTLGLSAGNNVTLNNSLSAGDNWNVNLTAGTAFVPTPGQLTPSAGSDGIYLNGSSALQAINGGLTLDAANEVIVSSGAIRTTGGGNIDVTTQYGDVNSGTGAGGFNYLTVAPWYTPASSLGGISTAAGGNVTINAGGDVISFPTTTVAASDPGTGAFGSKLGNVTINAGGNVYGNYVVMNGAGIINAGQNIGEIPSSQNPIFDNVALSLAKGSWNLNAQNNIYLQEVRNPNGVFDNKRFISGKVTGGNHLFDYDPQASVSLTAGNGVYITGNELPRPNDPVPMLLPPIVIINAGAGGVALQTPTATDGNPNDMITLSDYDITLFPSAYQNLEIATTDGGGFGSANANGSPATLLMSDSGQNHWFNSSTGTQPFSETDHASTPAELNNLDPVVLNISGGLQNLILQVSKFASITVGGDMEGFTFFGENLQPNQATSINVGGEIFNAGSFNSVGLHAAFPSLSAADFQPLGALPPGISLGSWYLPLAAAIDLSRLPNQSLIGVSQSQLATDINNARLFTDISLIGGNLVYDPNSKTLTAIGSLAGTDFLTALQTPTLTVVRYGPNGQPLLDLNQTLPNGQPNPNYGHLLTDTITWTPANSANYADFTTLNTESLGAASLTSNSGGLVVGGTGTFDVNANSISLGNSDGILSVGSGSVLGRDYSYLGSSIMSGADINVTAGYLEMPSSLIAALGGGNVNVTSTDENGAGTSMDLGSQVLAPFVPSVMQNNGGFALGIYTTGGGDVNVTGLGTINVDSSRIAAFNGGDIFVESYTGEVDAGSGGSTFLIPITVFRPDGSSVGEQVYANGIVAETLRNPSAVPHGATAPGDITILTPQGDINANAGGIKQEALNGTTPESPVVTLTAGTPLVPGDYLNKAGPPIFIGNISLGTVGVIGETVIAQATGTITGLAVSKHNTSITSQSVGSLTVLAGGTANVTVQSSGSGSGITIIGGAGVNANGIGAGATLLGQNVVANGNAATSTMGTSATATAASQSAAGQASAETQQQVANNDGGNDDEKKKKKTGLSRSVGRVTVVLPKAG
ncbi:MAG TPA: filamentous hemagglutinin N-terminal domain-containing protein [Candidatus Acidoferrales bacterium]|nr:filamentous hemagglutinin N-terminal domain-containing protein [Candidatus Acidoferrales bacterium]